jgi:hypothetical protein
MHVPIGCSGVQAVPNTLHSHGCDLLERFDPLERTGEQLS